MPRLEVIASIVVPEGITATAALVALGDDPDWETTADLEADGRPSAIALPAAGVVQEAGVEIRVDGDAISADSLCGPWSVTRSRREAIQQANFGIELQEWGISPLGDPFAKLGSPTGKKSIEFYGCYRDDDSGAVFKYPLLLRGIADSVSRGSSPDGGHTESYQVLDAGARYGRTPMTIVLPPGHGLPEGRIVRKFLSSVGETQFDLEDGRRRYKEIQFVDADPVAASQEVVDVSGRVVRWDRYGRVVNPVLDRARNSAVASINEENILAITTVSLSMPVDAVTKVTATGTEQIHSDTDDDVCGATTQEFQIETFLTFAPWEATQRQETDCSLTALTPAGEPIHQLHTLVVTRITKQCDKVRREETETWQFYNPEAARYYWGGTDWDCLDGTIIATTGVDGIFLVAASPSDGTAAYARRRAFWTRVGRTVTTYYYDATGWQGPTGLWGGELLGNPVGIQTGAFIGSITDSETWYNVRTATKYRAGAPDPFETIDPIANVLRTGPGETVTSPAESFQRTSRLVTIVRNDAAAGVIESQSEISYGFAVTNNGTNYEFTDGALSDEQDEEFQWIGERRTVYTPTVENMHSEAVITLSLGQSPKVETHNVEGGPPAAEYLPGYEPYDADEFLDEEDAEFRVEAHDEETRPIEYVLDASDLLTTHLPREVKVNFPYAEDTDELHEAANRVIRESLIFPLQITLAANFLLKEDDAVDVTHRPIGGAQLSNRRCVIDSITWSGGPGQPIQTDLQFEIYPP